MIRFRLLPTLTLVSLSTLALGTMACSGGQSPTEPSFDNPAASKSLAVSQDKRHGSDDPAGDDHGGQQTGGADDPAGDDHGANPGDNHGGRNGRPQRPARAAQAEGAVASVDAGSGILVLSGGQRIAVNGQTQWNRRGDLVSLQQVAAAVIAGKPTRAEARGARQADGSLLAQTIKAEVDGR